MNSRKAKPKGPVSAHYTDHQIAALVRAMRPLEPGSVTSKLEAELAARFSVAPNKVVCTNACTAALMAAAYAGRVNRVIAPILTWPGTYAWARMLTNTSAILHDMWPGIWGEVSKLEELASVYGERAMFIEVGYGCSEPLTTLPRNFGQTLRVLDGAHAAIWEFQSGSWKSSYDAVCLSFYDTKPLGGIRGGALIVNNWDAFGPDAERNARSFIRSGVPMSPAMEPTMETGFNGYMADQNAAVVLAGLRSLPALRSQLKEQAQIYWNVFSRSESIRPVSDDLASHIFVVKAETLAARERYRSALLQKGYRTQVHYSLSTWFSADTMKRYPSAADFTDRIFSLPFGAHVTAQDCERVARIIFGQ